MALENVDDVYPLTPMQRLMLVHAAATGDAGAVATSDTARGPAAGTAAGTAIGTASDAAASLLDNQFCYDIDGPLDGALLQRAWQAVVDRHAALRTAFLWNGLAQPLQVVRTRVALPFTVIDLESEPVGQQRLRLEELRRADAAQPYDLARAPLMRCTLVRLGPELHHFIWNVHHLIVDRWSHELIFADVSACCAAWERGAEPALEPCGQFREYAAWLQRQRADEAEDFWRRALRGFREPSLIAGLRGERQAPRLRTQATVSAERVRALEKRAAEWRTTGNSILLAALGATLARRTGQADVAWGLTVSGRPPELHLVEQTVGSFVNNVPLRTRIDPARAVGDWVRDIQSGQAARQPFDYLSPASIRDAAPLPAAAPLFDLLVVVNQDARSPHTLAPSFTMRPVGATFDGAYPLVLGILNRASGVEFTLVHDASFTDAEGLLDDVVGDLGRLLEAAPDATLGDVVPGLPLPREFGEVAELQLPTPPLAAGDDPTSIVRTIWCEVLGRHDVELDDDLFMLGASSLQATRIFAMLERRLGRPVPLSLLLGATSVRALARALQGTGESSATAPVRHGPTSDPAPLSFAQERLWILDQLDGASAVYNMAEAFRLRGPLSTEALRAALEQLVERHTVLRAAYPAHDGEVVQQVGDGGLDWAVEELREADGSWHTDGDALRTRLDHHAWLPFRLETGPLFRARLLRTGNDAYVLLLVMHHSVSDGWSVGVIKDELGALYNAAVHNRPASLPALPFQYADFASWQREQLRGERLRGLVQYWRETLDGVAPLELPTDHPRPAVQTFRGSVFRATLPARLIERVRELCREEGTTLNMALTAAFHVLLSRYSGQTDIVVGAPFAGRTRVDIEPLIGMFVNTLAIRSNCAGDRTFRDLLREIRVRSLEAHARQELPFEKLVEELQPARDLSRNPIVQVLFSLQDTPDRTLRLDQISMRDELLDQHSAKLDLSLYLREARSIPRPGGDAETAEPGGIDALWEFATDLFDRSTITRMHGHYAVLLAALVDHPAGRIGDMPLMDAQEYDDLLVRWNHTAVARTAVNSVQELVEAQADRRPDAHAVSDADRALSYAELDARANQLAHHLQAVGLTAGSLAAIRLPRSVDSVVAVLGILKAGAAFLPLDPALPAERTRYMLDNAGADLVVTTAELLATLPNRDLRAVCVDRDAGELEGYPVARPMLQSGPHSLAYVIYTSGSTGRPKGVEVTHANLVHLLQEMVERPGFSEGDAMLSIATLAFDIALLELLGPLSVGGRVRIANETEIASGESLRRLLENGSVTHMQATPPTWHMLLEAGWSGDPALHIWVGAEPLAPSLARQLHERAAGVWNLYGPTETTVWASTWRVPANAERIRIGRPIGNVRMYVLDGAMHPVPQGVPGDLYIGGAGVARGYRHSPDLTAAQFVPDPFSSDPEARLYRTGDRVRMGADRELEYLGRTDRQVKIRGFRIELGEIEAVLMEHDGVRQSLVVGRAAGTMDARLVAYIVLHESGGVTSSEIRRHLRKRLPDYMVPGFVIELDGFPRTPNGKIDRAALPDPLSASVRADADHLPPVTPSEQLIARIWERLLGRDRVGRQDNFYELGGHSLLGLKAAAAIRNAAGTGIDPRAMFFQTLEQLAVQLDQQRS